MAITRTIRIVPTEAPRPTLILVVELKPGVEEAEVVGVLTASEACVLDAI